MTQIYRLNRSKKGTFVIFGQKKIHKMNRDEIFEKFGAIYSKSRRFLMDRLKLDTTDLIRAIDKNDIEMAYRALRAGVNPNRTDGINRLPLTMAVDGNCVEIVELLLASDANPNVRDEKGESPLYKATVWENIEIMQLLMKAGAKKDFPNGNGKTVNDAATMARDINVGKVLAGIAVAKPAEQVVKPPVQKPAEDPVKKEDVPVVQKSEEQVVVPPIVASPTPNVEEKSRIDQKAKDLAIHEKMKAEAEAKRLEAERQKQAAEEEERLAKLAKAKEAEAAKAAEEAKKAETVESRYNVEKSGYLSALIMSIMKKDPEAFGTFLPKVEDLNVFDPLMREYPLSSAINLAKIFDALIENGANPYFSDGKHPAPIIKAIEKGTIAILPVLVQEKVSLEEKAGGRSLLSWAIEFKRTDWVAGLIHEGANVNEVDPDGDSLLIQAIQAKDYLIIETLLKAGADQNAVDSNGKTVTEIATELGDETILKLF